MEWRKIIISTSNLTFPSVAKTVWSLLFEVKFFTGEMEKTMARMGLDVFVSLAVLSWSTSAPYQVSSCAGSSRILELALFLAVSTSESLGEKWRPSESARMEKNLRTAPARISVWVPSWRLRVQVPVSSWRETVLFPFWLSLTTLTISLLSLLLLLFYYLDNNRSLDGLANTALDDTVDVLDFHHRYNTFLSEIISQVLVLRGEVVKKGMFRSTPGVR